MTIDNIIVMVVTVVCAWSCVWTTVYILWCHKYERTYPDWWQEPRWSRFHAAQERITAIAWFYLPKSLRP